MIFYGFGATPPPPEPVQSTWEDILHSKGMYSFYRGSVLCCITKTEFGFCWGHIGVKRGHPGYGRLFVVSNGIRLHRVSMRDLGNDSQNNLWWLGFEGSRPVVPEAVHEEVCRAADGFETAKFQ
jgi:hypothetical protein